MNFENRGLLHSVADSEDNMYKTDGRKMVKEESKHHLSQDSDHNDKDGIEFFDDNDDNKQLSKKSTIQDNHSFTDRDVLMKELKRSKDKINKIIHKKEQYNKDKIHDYNDKFEEEVDEEIMDVGAVDLAELETEFGMVEDERERKKKQRELEYEHRKKGIHLTASTTQNKLINTQSSLLKEIAQEEIEARKKAIEREKIIKKEFKRVEGRISGVIKEQRFKILSYFGPLVQEKKHSAYQILGNAKKKVDLSARTKI